MIAIALFVGIVIGFILTVMFKAFWPNKPKPTPSIKDPLLVTLLRGRFAGYEFVYELYEDNQKHRFCKPRPFGGGSIINMTYAYNTLTYQLQVKPWLNGGIIPETKKIHK